MYGRIGPRSEPVPLTIQEISNGYIVEMPQELPRATSPFEGLAKEIGKALPKDKFLDPEVLGEEYDEPDCNIYVFHDYKEMMEFVTEYYARTAFEGKEEWKKRR